LLDLGGLPDVLLDNGDELVKTSAAPLAEVEYFIRMRTVDGADDAVNDIGYVGVISAGCAVAKLLQLDSTAHSVNELVGCHVRSSSRSVHGEEAKAGNVKLV